MENAKKNVPDIRFPGFTDPWEQRKLGKLIERYEDPVETPREGYERLGLRSHAKGTFHSTVEAGQELEAAKMHRVAANKFILNITFAWEHAVAITTEEDAGKLVSHRFPQFSFIGDLQPDFFRYVMLDKRFREHLALSSPGGAGRNKVLKINDMLEYKISYPCIEEQQRISHIFDEIDKAITLHQCKHYRLKTGDPSGKSDPFSPCNTATWEQRKVKDVCSISTGKSNTQDKIDDGEYPFYVRSPIIEHSNKYLFDEEAVLTVGDGVGTGKVFHYVNGKYDLHQRVYRLYGFSEDTDAKFFYHWFSSHFYDRVMSMTAKTSVDSVRLEMISDMIFVAPGVEEQRRIASSLSYLDVLITLHQCNILQHSYNHFWFI